ncbi:hypothetical protein F5141DRAFT_1060676 [Pisolithus sp. B1]|nr:hypothetical protein F5141DRAFT_1060676 [Pisolithus sp. B1]
MEREVGPMFTGSCDLHTSNGYHQLWGHNGVDPRPYCWYMDMWKYATCLQLRGHSTPSHAPTYSFVLVYTFKLCENSQYIPPATWMTKKCFSSLGHQVDPLHLNLYWATNPELAESHDQSHDGQDHLECCDRGNAALRTGLQLPYIDALMPLILAHVWDCLKSWNYLVTSQKKSGSAGSSNHLNISTIGMSVNAPSQIVLSCIMIGYKKDRIFFTYYLPIRLQATQYTSFLEPSDSFQEPQLLGIGCGWANVVGGTFIALGPGFPLMVFISAGVQWL